MKTNTFSYKWFQQVWNDGNESAIDELLSPDIIAHGLSNEVKKNGISGFKDYYRQFRKDFSNIHVVVEEVVCQGNIESARTTVTAIHTSTGKEVAFSGMIMSIIRNGKVIETWNNFDFLTMNLQLGNKIVAADAE